ncbi:ABC transporter substrate-binding protein [Paenibacillus oceani]|uniref:Extracellular solute-binding protein n=1 Tax=Paenibacillus oceani TaxID=2772510 RepID=A0A927H1N7_9BACL|nr:extracellular solute-binding protein [Paenibacillus oceani]MBD2864528.1 extracellular solute-binding protein [Paenibacillus oceani]
MNRVSSKSEKNQIAVTSLDPFESGIMNRNKTALQSMRQKAKLPLLIVLVTSVAAACSGGSSGNGSGATPGAGAEGGKPAVKKADPIELVFYSRSGDFDNDGFMKMFGNKIKEKFPHITPKFIPRTAEVTLPHMVTAGETLDILYLSSGQTNELLDVQLQYDISDLIKQNKYDLNRLESTTIDIQRLIADGGIYGLPVFNNTMTMFYNKDLFDKFGVAYPKDGMTWDGVYDLSKQMARTDGDVQYQGFTLSMSHNMLVNQFSIPYTDKQNKVNFTSDEFKKLFDMWTRFYHLPGNEVTKKTVSYGVQVDKFDKEKSTAIYLGLAALGPARFKDNFNWDVASFPEWKEKPGVGPQPYPSYFYVTNTSKHKEQAFDVIVWLTSDEFQRHLARNGLFPTLNNRDAMKDFGQDVPYLKTKNFNSFLPQKFASPAKPSDFAKVGSKHLTRAFNSVSLKEKDINTALREAEEAANKEIQTLLSGGK